MAVYEINPLADPRWEDLLLRDSRASVFHTTAWLRALQRAYGYEPIVFTTSAPGGELENGIVFCHVRSWLTGRRLVSLPFSDHCEPLTNNVDALAEITSYLNAELKRRDLRYVEFRPRTLHDHAPSFIGESEEFCFHDLDLKRSDEQIFRGLHKTAIRQQIQRAEREHLQQQVASSRALLDDFYKLFVSTRRRQGIPVTPLSWFRTLMDCMGDSMRVHLAMRDGKAVASVITLRYRDSTVYKYGASDARFNNLGGVPFLLWRVILGAKSEGCVHLDLGRSDCDNAGLITFKGRLGSTASKLKYLRIQSSNCRPARSARLSMPKGVLAVVPKTLFIGAGRLLYKHVG